MDDAALRFNPQRPLLAVSIGVFRAGQVLLVQRADYGHWSLPGGLVEAGEHLEKAALRELIEETGVEAENLIFSHLHEIIDRDADGRLRHHYVIAVYAARWSKGNGKISEETQGIGWFDPGDIGRLYTTDGLVNALKQVQAVWEKHQLEEGR